MSTGADLPRVSVVMAVHNVLPYVEESIRSILAQSLADFEFVIGDDGSSDGTSEILRALAEEDERIRLLRRERASGLVGSANWVVGESRAPLVARMDADDLSHPDRLARQVELLDRELDAQLVGFLCDGIEESGRRVRSADWWRLSGRSPFSPFPHSSIMFRRSAFASVGGYRPEAEYWEDLDLYFRIAERGRILVIPDVLTSVRFTAISTRLTNDAERVDEAVDLMYRSVEDYMNCGIYPRRFPPASGPQTRLQPETYFGRGSVQVWAGHRPRIFKRLLRRADLRLDLVSIAVLGWSLWATLNVASLRLFLRGVMRLQRVGLARRLQRRTYVEWNPADARSRHRSVGWLPSGRSLAPETSR